MLPDRPPATLGGSALSRQRLCPRSDWAPPAALPPTTLQVYVAASTDSTAFGVTIVAGGDAELDHTALPIMDMAGRVAVRSDDPAWVGADAISPLHAHLSGVTAGLEALAAQGDAAPLVLRLGDPAVAACVAGTWEPATARCLHARVMSLLRATRNHRTHVWVAGYDPSRLHSFGERASALAFHGNNFGYWEELPPPLAGGAPTAPSDPPWQAEECAICYSDFIDVWPSADTHSRAAPGRWHCPHAICRDCDSHVQHAPNDKCPLCRAQRRVHMHP